jgi:curved DNA-binding protein
MTDYYNILGVSRSATQDDIKRAYRKLAMKHHPDRGGDASQFQKIQEAYDVLSDDEKRYQHDNPHQSHFHYSSNGHEDVFSTFFGGAPFGFGFQQPQQRNAAIGATVALTLEEVLVGKTIEAEISFRNGQKKLVSINIPAGIDDNIQIRYPGMGDHSLSKLPPGDLIVTVRVMPHAVWRRDGTNIIADKTISVWEALLGTELTFNTLEGKTLSITIPAGTQPGTVFSCKGEGLPHPRSGARGSALIKVRIQLPKTLSEKERKTIEDLKNGI